MSASANLSYLVHHETGHQWFYGIVGNDQANEPFTDEAVTDFLARYVLGQQRASRCSTARLDLSIYRTRSACYYEIVYIQGGNFLDDLRRTMGNRPRSGPGSVTTSPRTASSSPRRRRCSTRSTTTRP